jgi:galactonate dehydratase
MPASPVEQLGFDNRELFPVQVELEDGAYIVPDGPGLGVDVYEDRLRVSELAYSEPPHLRRRYGPFTNW